MPTTSSRRSQPKGIVRAELGRLSHWEERHRRLAARVLIAVVLTTVVDAVGSILVWYWERGAHGSDVHGFGDSVF
ncbi:MAG: hypothetical protein JO017_06030, partial [Actinobacteria bacterium]|nr:hypothetical protein [Actinomycetota bacterium]